MKDLPEQHESGFLLAFVLPAHRERLRMLMGRRRRQKHRAKVASKWSTFVCHGPEIDERCRRPVQQRRQLLEELKALGATDHCYVMSDRWEVDGRVLPIEEVVRTMVESFRPCVVSCIPGKLGFHQPEAGEDDLSILVS